MSTDEKGHWITLKNGTRCLVDTQGNILKGPDELKDRNLHDLNQEDGVSVLEDTNPKSSEYQRILKEHNGNHYEAAREFFKDYLQNSVMKGRIGDGVGYIAFTGTGFKKLKFGLKLDPLKAALIPHIPDIIDTGQYFVDPLNKARDDDKILFHSYKKIVPTKEGNKEVIVDVSEAAESVPTFVAYNLTREGTKNYEIRKEERKKNEKPSQRLGANPDDTRAKDASGTAQDASFKTSLPKEYEVVNIRFADEIMKDGENNLENILIAFDASSSRRYDTNGFLHVDLTPITKEQVVHYLGIEIPRWREHGLDPQKEYWGYRPADEIEKAASTFNGLPVMLNHHVVTPDTPAKDYQVGHTGTDAEWSAPYLENSLIITDRMGIEGIENGTYRQISAAYRYDPDFTPGVFDGKPYDFVIRNMRGNHVALVKKGRAGPDVVVADAEPEKFMNESQVEAAEVGAAEAIKELASLIVGVHYVDPETGETKDMTQDEDKNAAIGRLLDVLSQYVPEDAIGKLKDELTDLAYTKPTGDNDLPIPEAVKFGEKKEMGKEERKEIPGGKDAAPMNTAEAVAAGENHERKKLDSEHESEGMKAAMDACGLDSDNPEVVKAFAAGMGAKPAMDSAELVEKVTRKSFAELSKRNQLAESVSKFIGSFAFDSMTTHDVAMYAAKKIGLNVSPDQAVTAVEAYLHDRPVPSSKAMAMDSAPEKNRENQVSKFYELR